MINILSCAIVVLASSRLCGSTISDLEHPLLHNVNSSNEQLASWISEASEPEFSPYVRASEEFVPNIRVLLTKYYTGNDQGEGSPIQRNPHFANLGSHQRRLPYQQHGEGRHDYRPSSYQDHYPMHSIPEHNVTPLRKHDYDGGWDMFSGGGMNFGHGAGLANVGQSLKKGKEAKAFFFLMAPLILLAVFGPILATQSMLPWIANGGMSSITTIAGSGKRRKRTLRDPRQMAELEKRLQLFFAVQDFIAQTGSTDFAQEMGEAFLQCQKFTERRNKCLERVACEYNDKTSPLDSSERRIAKMVFQNVMSNPMIPASIKGRLSKGSMFGRNHRGLCRNYWCEALDGPKTTT